MFHSLTRILLFIALVGGGSISAHADNSFSANVGGVSDYLFRGISQTWGRPAIQGGGDATWDNGFAAGFWVSSLGHEEYPGAAAELDLYASYGAPIDADWSWRAGLYAYVYPGGDLDKARPSLSSRSFDTAEVNASITWKWLTAKINRSVGDYFAIDREQGFRSDSHGTRYMQLDAAIPLGARWTVLLHGGHTYIPTLLSSPTGFGARDASYSDFCVSAKRQLTAQWTASVGVSRANNDVFYGHLASFLNPNDLQDVGGTRGFLQVQGTF